MTAMREELHSLVDRLPEERVASVLAIVRASVSAADRRAQAIATFERVRDRMAGVTGLDEERSERRDGTRV